MNQRQTQIVELISKNKKMSVVELSEKMAVSQVTIRKDLGELEKNGLVVREHGYATIHDSDDINQRLVIQYETKQKIAQKAADLIQDGETIMIESGSCCALFAQVLAQTKKDITIITNSAFIAGYVRKIANIRIILLGGSFQNESQVMVGPMVKSCVEMYHVDKLFIGTDGFSKESGFTGNDMMRAEAVQNMAKQASKVFILTDSKKFSQTGLIRLLPSHSIYGVVTDTNIPEDMKLFLEQEGVQVY
ncbi:MAG: DeoR/GlpR family DNA-binding transcription regulator [Bacillota bacterium]|nr:DeoR/GlpR family DNA-binding transcription regulator [Bacillota bacterium]